MYNYYTTTYSGRTIHIVEARADDQHDVQISVMGGKYDTADSNMLLSYFGDGYLTGNGWTMVGVINGGIYNGNFANGIEVVGWNIHENDDSTLDGVMGIGHVDSNITVALQSELKANITSYRGALTGAFGLRRGGANTQGNTSMQGSYSSLSGRSMIGKKADGTVVLAATAGTTGSSGLTGLQLRNLAEELGLTDAIGLDGGGSVGLRYLDDWKVSSSRQVKNAIGLFVKQGGGPGPGPGPDPDPLTFRDTYIPVFRDELKHMAYIDGKFVRIKELRSFRNGQWVKIKEIRRL